jgi:hypothetical protein
MKKILYIIIIYLISHSKTVRAKVVFILLELKRILKEENHKTKVMVEIYNRMLKKKATPEEISWAHRQFGDILKTAGLGALLVLPFAPITLPFFIKLGKLVGINILPSSAHKKTEHSSPE